MRYKKRYAQMQTFFQVFSYIKPNHFTHLHAPITQKQFDALSKVILEKHHKKLLRALCFSCTISTVHIATFKFFCKNIFFLQQLKGEKNYYSLRKTSIIFNHL